MKLLCRCVNGGDRCENDATQEDGFCDRCCLPFDRTKAQYGFSHSDVVPSCWVVNQVPVPSPEAGES